MGSERHKLIKGLAEKGLRLAIVESMTCGLASGRLSGVKGVSDVLMGGVVCYTPEMKHQVLGVSHNLMKKYTCESPQVTAALSAGLRKLTDAEVLAAITGLAAPGGSETPTKPVGTVFFSLRYKQKHQLVEKRFRGSPAEVKVKACEYLYELLNAFVGTGK